MSRGAGLQWYKSLTEPLHNSLRAAGGIVGEGAKCIEESRLLSSDHCLARKGASAEGRSANGSDRAEHVYVGALANGAATISDGRWSGVKRRRRSVKCCDLCVMLVPATGRMKNVALARPLAADWRMERSVMASVRWPRVAIVRMIVRSK